MTVTNPAYLEYVVSYIGRVCPDATLGALYLNIDQDNVTGLKFGYDPDANGGIGESTIRVFTLAPFTPTELATIEAVTNIPTIWLESSADNLLAGVPGYDEAIIELWSGQGVTSITLTLNGVPVTLDVGILTSKVRYTLKATSMGVVVIAPAANQPIFVPVQITVGEMAACSILELG